MSRCAFCSKPTNDGVDFCDWECHVSHSMRNGGRVYTPNGLPIRCIRNDGLMLEHEHGDHPDYKFPVVVQGGGEASVHALIYVDDTVALTINEHSYALWHLSDGSFLSSTQRMWSGWKLNQVSLTQIREMKSLEANQRSDYE